MDLDDISPINIIGSTSCSAYFDEVIGQIEDIVLSEKFEAMHDNFLEMHWQSIDHSEENKLEYMDIFQEYTTTFESFFIEELSRRMPHFDMQRFAEDLEMNTHPDALDTGEIFELLKSFSNFQTFKELMLDYRCKKEGNTQHLDFDILITKPISVDSTAMDIVEPTAAYVSRKELP